MPKTLDNNIHSRDINDDVIATHCTSETGARRKRLLSILLDLLLYAITRIYWELKISIPLDSEMLFILLQSQYYFKVSNLES